MHPFKNVLQQNCLPELPQQIKLGETKGYLFYFVTSEHVWGFFPFRSSVTEGQHLLFLLAIGKNMGEERFLQ